MTAFSRARLPALACCLAFLLCVFIARPFAEMGICDDWSYILTTQKLASTGHIAYNGWATAMLGWQLYLGAAFVKLFGFSFTTVRMSTLFVATVLAWLLQRTLVRAGISECNAAFGTLALILSPLFMMLSVTDMTDIPGLFALVVCLYACLRALQAASPRSTIGWIYIAVLGNVVCGSSRQIAWLGVLVMVPSTLWILHTQQRLLRRLMLAAGSATLLGWLSVFLILNWFKHQPYSIPEHLLPKTFSLQYIFFEFSHAFLDTPFLLLPLVLLFFPVLRSAGRRSFAFLGIVSIAYLLLVYHWRHFVPNYMLEPAIIDWVTIYGIYQFPALKGSPPLFLYPATQAILTLASIGGLLCLLITPFLRSSAFDSSVSESVTPSRELTWKQIAMLLGPYTAVYLLILVARATQSLLDRYTLPLLVLGILCMLRLYQQAIRPRVPSIAWLGIVLFAAYGVVSTHNLFAFYRARVALAAELRANGIPDTAVDNGWEYNGFVELQHAASVNDPRLILPANAYTPMPERIDAPCTLVTGEEYPHLTPRFAISFDPNACLGPTPFAPITYSRWPALHSGTLYVIRVPPPPNH